MSKSPKQLQSVFQSSHVIFNPNTNVGSINWLQRLMLRTFQDRNESSILSTQIPTLPLAVNP